MFSQNPLFQNPVHPSPLQKDNKKGKLISLIEKCFEGTMSIIDLAAEAQALEGGRRTDGEIEAQRIGMEKDPRDFQIEKGVPLSEAISLAENTTGVYIIYLNGAVMKCGRAAYGAGVAWRFRQYYNLSYDDRARAGDLWAINKENRDRVTVTWQCCPPSVCHELEYKLFRKYGKGPWAKKAPTSCSTDRWKLLI